MKRETVSVFIACFICLVTSGCRNDTPEGNEFTSHFLYSAPANGEKVIVTHGFGTSIELFFDREPLEVTILGQKAKIDGNKAVWTGFITKLVDFSTNNIRIPSPIKLHIAWVNYDWTKGEGAEIALYPDYNDGLGPAYMGGIADGEKNLDKDVLNREGIVLEFHEKVVTTSVVLAIGESIRENRTLNWTRTVEDKTVRFERLKGEPLKSNTAYLNPRHRCR